MNHNVLISTDLGSYPIRRLGREDTETLITFVAALDERALTLRFHRHMTPRMVRAHYHALDWDATIVLAWSSDDVVRGVCEAILYGGHSGLQAEIALCVRPGWHGHGIGQLLVARAVSEAARFGAARSVMVLHQDEWVHARIIRRLGGTVDWNREIAVLTH